MSPKDRKGHGSSDKDPKLAKLADIIRKAPFGPDEPAKVEAGVRAVIAKALAKKFGRR